MTALGTQRRYGGCGTANDIHKRTYTKAEAKLARKRIAAQGGPILDVYRCANCDHWHLGHPRTSSP